MKAKLTLLFLLVTLSGCDASLSNEDKKEIAELKKELIETKQLLSEIKSSYRDVTTTKSVKPVFISKPVYKTKTDKEFHQLTSKFDVIDIRVTPTEGFYKVAFINERKHLVNVKEISVPMSFFKSVYDSENRYRTDDIKRISQRGYSAKLLYLLDQGERFDEKKAILELYNKNFS